MVASNDPLMTFDCRRQRSPPYLTSGQLRDHFFCHAKGRSQARRNFVGKWGLRCVKLSVPPLSGTLSLLALNQATVR